MSTVAPHNPFWVFFVRIAQGVLALVLLALAAAIGGGGDLADAPALVVASAVFTWLVVAYAILTDKIGALNKLYHIFAIIALDGFLAIMWLCAWALSAARAAQYQAAIDSIDNSYGDGCGIFGCYRKRDLQKRYLTVGAVKGLLGACAGLGALIWLLIIATLVLNVLGLLRGANKTADNEHQMEETKTQPAVAAQPQVDAQQQHIQPQYTGQDQPQYIQPQYTGQEHQQPIQPQYTGPEQHQQNYTQQAQAAPGEVQYPPVAPPAPHN